MLVAAEAEFGAHGFSSGSLNVIARNAGVSKGSLFQYFEGKADLCAHLSDVISMRVRVAVEDQITQLCWSEDFFGALRDICNFWMDYFACHPADLAFASAATLEPDPVTGAPVRAAVNQHYIAVFRPLLQRARETGQLSRDADVDMFLAMMMLVLPHLAIAPSHPGLDGVLGLSENDPGGAQKVVDRLIAVLRAAFAPSQHP